MGENEKGKYRGENKKAPATKRPQMLIHNKIQMITYSKPTSTAQATVQPTIGLLPIPRNPIIST